MNCNILAQKKQYGREKLSQHPSSMKYLATAIAACLVGFQPIATAQTAEPRTLPANISSLVTLNSSSSWETGTEPDDITVFASDTVSPVGIWLKQGTFKDTADKTRVETPALFQIGGSTQYSYGMTDSFGNETDTDKRSMIFGSLYTGKPPSESDPKNPDPSSSVLPSLTIAVIGSPKSNSEILATQLNSWNSQTDLSTEPEKLDIYIDGANNSSTRTALTIKASAHLSSQNRTSLIVQNSGVLDVGKELTLKMLHSDDRLLLQNNTAERTGLIVQGTSENVENLGDKGTNFILYNSATLPVDAAGNIGESDRALIKNSNVEVTNGVFSLGGYMTGPDGKVFGPENTFLQIINDDQSRATFSARTLEVYSQVSGNTTTLLLGHGANVDTDCISLRTDKDNRTSILMLGDTNSNDANYSPNIKSVNVGKLIATEVERDEQGKITKVLKTEDERGTRKIIFNNGYRGEGATEASFHIYGYGGTVQAQSGRTILPRQNDYTGHTIIDPKATLILKHYQAAGSSDIEIGSDENGPGELIYRGVRGPSPHFYRLPVINSITGSGNVIFDEKSNMYMTDNGKWTGSTTIKDAALALLGTNEKPIRMSSSVVTTSNGGLLWGYGALDGSLNNAGSLMVGGTGNHPPRADFTIAGKVTNSGVIGFGNYKTTENTLTVGDYSGDNGKIYFNTYLNGDDDSPTDKLIVKGNVDGQTWVHIHKLGGVGAQTKNGIELIRVEGTSTDDAFAQDGRIVAGAYDYLLERGTGTNANNWYLKSYVTDPTTNLDDDDEPNPHDDQTQPFEPPQNETPLYRPEIGAYIGNSAVVQTLFSSRLHDRIGDLWYANPYAENNQLTGMWVKQRGNYNTWRESSGQTRNRTQMYATQIGADVASWTSNGENRFLVGWVAGYGHGRTKSRSIHTGYHAIGTVDGLNVGITGTWYQDGTHHEGMYVDTWLTYGWFDNKVKGQGIETEKYHSRGFTGSLETGYTWKLGEHVTEKGCDIGWFLQPQAQVIWSGVKTDTFHEHNGTAVKSKGRNNIQTRLGARLMLDTNLRSYANGIGGTQLFIEGNWVHNTKSHGVEMNGTVLNQEGARHLGEVKFGINGKPTDNLHIWTNVTARAGTHHYRDLTGMIGLKYSF